MISITELAAQIIQDIQEPVAYLPYGLLLGGICIFIFEFVHIYRRKKTDRVHVFVFFLLITYLTVLMIQAFFSRESGSRTGIEFYPFSILGISIGEDASFIENILMFLPFGILVPLAFRFLRSGFYCVGIAFIGSVSLEILQLITGRGYCQVDDVISNTLGAFFGWFFTAVWFAIRRRNEEKVYAVRSFSMYQFSR
ncbi:MAG: VanZ family protein [Butyrivibrio sp.]|jgi:glycopeptide antibiotics resistance protein|nr:VanZ family protein [Butyrivibrio sp.]